MLLDCSVVVPLSSFTNVLELLLVVVSLFCCYFVEMLHSNVVSWLCIRLLLYYCGVVVSLISVVVVVSPVMWHDCAVVTPSGGNATYSDRNVNISFWCSGAKRIVSFDWTPGASNPRMGHRRISATKRHLLMVVTLFEIRYVKT